MLFSSVLVLLVSVVVIERSSGEVVSVTFDGVQYEIHEGVVEFWVAKVNFTDTTFDDGWAYMEVESNPEYPDAVQAYAAGLAEGATSSEMIYNAYRNTLEGICETSYPEFCGKLREFLAENLLYMEAMVALEGQISPLWHNVELILAQLNGVTEGYNRTGKEPMMEDAMLWLNLMGDRETLEEALDPSVRNMTSDEWVAAGHTPKDGHCSALIKVLSDNSDLYVAQDTWTTYQSMLRIMKKYILPFRRTGDSDPRDIIPGHTVSFSSYPGMLFSGDDFHIMSSGLVSMETTIGNSNPELWVYVTPQDEILEWMRTIIANRIAEDGESWTKWFAKYNSGTYNNQWMVVDYKLFEPGTSIKPNTLWVLEQIPGYVESGDQTDFLVTQSYWASYNSPFYETVFNMSGNQAMVDKYGDWFTYDKTPRALIFKRDHDSVEDIDSMTKLMRYNDYTNDPLSRCNCTPPYSAENAISARCDLNPKNGTYPFSALGHRAHGATDMKLTTYEMVSEYRFLAVNSPTYDQVRVFRWSEQDFADDIPHYGHPDEWQFPVVDHVWLW